MNRVKTLSISLVYITYSEIIKNLHIFVYELYLFIMREFATQINVKHLIFLFMCRLSNLHMQNMIHMNGHINTTSNSGCRRQIFAI